MTAQQTADLELQRDRIRRAEGFRLGEIRPLPATVRALAWGTLRPRPWETSEPENNA
jgi:hypothetical protein